jgi:CHAD domain-containing protein
VAGRPIENEVKMGASPGFRVPPLDDSDNGLSALARPDVVLQATYFDTPDLRLTRAGASLRYRSDDGWTVKLPTEGQHGDALHRSELHVDGPPGSPPATALDLVRPFARSLPVGVVSRLRTLRRRVDLFDTTGERVGEVDDDEVSVLDGRRVGARFREIEVEITGSAPDGLQQRVVEQLRNAGAGAPDPVPKVVRALGPRALEPPDVVVRDLDDDASAGEVVRSAIANAVRRLIVHDAGVRLGDDPEAVHQARVATRRLRSDLRTFRDFVEPDWNESLRDELKWLGGELGTVRDGDVLVDRLRSHARQLPDDEHLVVDRVISQRATERDDSHSELLDAYRSARYVELLERLVDASRDPLLTEAAGARAADVLPEVVKGPWKHLRDAVDALGDAPPDESLHDVRKRAKRCRYAIEAVTPVVGKRAREFATRVADVQEVLGEHQDAVVARTWLGKAAADLSPQEAYAAGMLAGVELGAAATSRDAFPAAWKVAAKKQLRSWL